MGGGQTRQRLRCSTVGTAAAAGDDVGEHPRAGRNLPRRRVQAVLEVVRPEHDDHQIERLVGQAVWGGAARARSGCGSSGSSRTVVRPLSPPSTIQWPSPSSRRSTPGQRDPGGNCRADSDPWSGSQPQVFESPKQRMFAHQRTLCRFHVDVPCTPHVCLKRFNRGTGGAAGVQSLLLPAFAPGCPAAAMAHALFITCLADTLAPEVGRGDGAGPRACGSRARIPA